MRIGTWNLDHARGSAKNARRLELMTRVGADVWILTETRQAIDLGPGHSAVHSESCPGADADERWVSIWSRFPVLESVETRDASRTVAAIVAAPTGPLLVFGTVLPWHADYGSSGDRPAWSEHHRVVPEQTEEWCVLRGRHPGVALCVAGDFNMSLGGKHYYGTTRGRALLRTGLRDADLVCISETDRGPASLLGHPPIDHICVSTPLATSARLVAAWEGTDPDGVLLSDHSGLVVEIAEMSHDCASE